MSCVMLNFSQYNYADVQLQKKGILLHVFFILIIALFIFAISRTLI